MGPFSLTPDARCHYRSRAHTRALSALGTGLARRAPLLLLTGDLGTGKSTVCRLLLLTHRDHRSVVYIPNALLTPDEFLRQLLLDLDPSAPDNDRRREVAAAEVDALTLWTETRLRELAATPPLVLIDEAHLLPPATVDIILRLAALDHDGHPLVQMVLAAQPPTVGQPVLSRAIEDSVSLQARLTPLERDECEPYVQHRLQASGASPLALSPRTIDALFALSGGVPRLVNLLCERALQEAAVLGVRRLEPSMFEAAAGALELLRLRSRRFRWFGIHRDAARL
jgi:general secretion pathway protein A